MPTLQQSIDLVKSKITGIRKGTDDIPNYLHSLRVNESLKKHGFDETTQMAGLLHDIVEDGGITLDKLREIGYTDDILHLVDLATHDMTINDSM